MTLGLPVTAPHDLADTVEAAWARHLQRHPADFDGQILHLRSWSQTGAGLSFVLAPMRFALQAARRSTDLPAELRDRIPGPLGLSVIPRTSDGRVILARRSTQVSIAQRSLFFFGGFGEPPQRDGSFDLAAEALRELREELGTGFAVVAVGLLGMGEGPAGHQHAVFLADLDIPAAAVLAQAGAAADAFEWDRLWAVTPEELLRLSPSDLDAGPSSKAFEAGRQLLAAHLDLPPVAAGGQRQGGGTEWAP
ncbi:MAG: NUDIX hydrolase [Sneathiellaceae bacterium]